MITNLCWYSTEHRSHSHARVVGTPLVPLLDRGVRINQEPGAVGKPRANLPLHALGLEHSRLRNSASLAAVNELDVQTSSVGKCQVFTVRRNCPPNHRVLAGVGSELTQFYFRG